MTRKLALRFAGAFAIVLAAFSSAAYWHFLSFYREQLGPAATTPEGAAGLALALRRVLLNIALVDIPLLALAVLLSFFIAGRALAPLVAAREREATFAAEAAHELRTPLASIAGIAQANALFVPLEQRQALERIAAIALDASRLVGDLLTLTRAEHAYALSTEPLDLAGLLVSTAREFEDGREGKRPILRLDPSSAIVDGDERRLGQLIRNLLDNAVRYAHSSIEARVWSAGGWAYLTVEDDGKGVPSELRDRIFERFVRAGNEGSGAGLGLAICRWVARAHAGEITLEGRARFVLRLPAHGRGLAGLS